MFDLFTEKINQTQGISPVVDGLLDNRPAKVLRETDYTDRFKRGDLVHPTLWVKVVTGSSLSGVNIHYVTGRIKAKVVIPRGSN